MNGKQIAQQNLAAFRAWVATQTDEDFKQIIFKGQLKRGEIAKSVGCGKSALNQNPALRQDLAKLETELRNKGILPQLSQAAKESAKVPQKYDNTANRKSLDAKRLADLEAENIELKAKIKKLENDLDRFSEDRETRAELGFEPR